MQPGHGCGILYDSNPCTSTHASYQDCLQRQSTNSSASDVLIRLQCCRFLGDRAIGPHAVVTLINFGVMFASLTEV